MNEDLSFDEHGRPVPEVPAPEPIETLEDWLLSRGIAPEDLGEALDMARAIGRAEATAAIGEILSRLEGTAAGIALQWVCLGAEDRSLRKLAQGAGVSHQAILKQAKRIRLKLGLPVPPLVG